MLRSGCSNWRPMRRRSAPPRWCITCRARRRQPAGSACALEPPAHAPRCCRRAAWPRRRPQRRSSARSASRAAASRPAGGAGRRRAAAADSGQLHPNPPPKPAPRRNYPPADSAERWRQPARRGLLGGVALLMALLLAGQMRCTTCDTWPPAGRRRGPCCRPPARLPTVEAPRHIDRLAVDSSSLVRLQDSRPVQPVAGGAEQGAHGRARAGLRPGADTIPRPDRRAPRVHGRRAGPAGRQLPPAATGAAGHAGPGRTPLAGYTVELFYP